MFPGVLPLSFMFLRNALVPEWAMVPRFFTSSSRVMPMPASEMVSVFASASVVMWISSGAAASWMSFSVASMWRSFSIESEALEISSRRKISLSV